MLNVSHKNRIGYFTETQTIGDQTHKYKLWLCHANCLCAIMYFYDQENEDGTKTPMTQLCGFFNDVSHIKRCLADGLMKRNSNYHFYAKEMDSDLWKVVKLLAENGDKVTIE